MIDLHRLPSLQHRSKEELAYHELRSAILSGVLKPGERLVPQDLADRFSVSTMPVRQALAKLERERLVTRIPNKELSVTPLSIKEIEDIYTLRVDLEGLAARLAVPKLTPQDIATLTDLVDQMEIMAANGQIDALTEANARFHFTIYRAGDNQRLVDIIRDLWDATARYRYLYFSGPGIPQHTLNEHRGILAALQARDTSQVELAVRADQEHSSRVLIDAVKAITATPA